MNNNIFSPYKTSAAFLVDFAREKYFGKNTQNESEEDRFAILYDLFIKARSYAMVNKVCWWLSVVSGLMVLAWPSIAIISKDFGWDKEFLKSAFLQTTITGLAALTFTVYSHYKKRQLYVENIMRYVLFSNKKIDELKEKVIQELERIDTGFVFSQAVLNKGNSNNTYPSQEN